MKESHRVLLVTIVVLVTITRNIFIYLLIADYMDISFATEVILPVVCKIEFENKDDESFRTTDTIASIKFTKSGTKRLINRIKRNRHWKKLPIDYGLGKILSKHDISIVENGYYFFKDRSTHSINRYSEDIFFNNICLSYTIAVLDVDNYIMYFYESYT